jgi:glucokinase
MSEAVIAVDLGGTKLASCLFVDRGRPIAKRAVPLEGRQGPDVAKLILTEAKRLQREAARRKLTVQAVGVCVPGIAGARTGRVWAPNIHGWDDYPRRAELSTALADKQI